MDVRFPSPYRFRTADRSPLAYAELGQADATFHGVDWLIAVFSVLFSAEPL